MAATEKKKDEMISAGTMEKKKGKRGSGGKKEKKAAAVVVTSGKKKRSIARTRIKLGMGTIRINGKILEGYEPELAKRIIEEPLKIAKDVLGGDFPDRLDIDINVKGGGFMGQAYACRTSLGKALVEWSESEELREKFTAYDRSIVVDDVRRREPKKPMRKGARARYQKSYR